MTELANMVVEIEMINVAKKLLKRGISVNAIAEDTGLEASIVEKLQLELEQTWQS